MFWRVSRLVLFAVVLAACGVRDSVVEERAPTDPIEIRRQPGLNILLITVDTLRADALGSYGNGRAATPWMDRLAAGGVRFADARAHNVVTLPTHASILTGLYPYEHGVRDNSGFRLSGELPTLATILQAEGYRTGAFVSAFPLDSRFGLDRGFEVYEDSFAGSERRSAFFEQERAGDRTSALAREWIDADDTRPWFCWLHLYEPHFPYDPPEPLRSRFRDAPYLGDVAAADAALGAVLAPILDPAVEGQTLVVLTSDHGEALGEHGEATHGIFAYEGTLRVPLIVHQPELLAPAVVSEPVRHIDILPTVLDVLALPIPESIPGRSLLAAAAGESLAGGYGVYFESLSPQLNRGWAPLYGIVDGGMKYIELPVPELYDLDRDPAEVDNLAAEEPELLAELRSKLASLRAGDPGALPAPEDAETVERLRSLGYLTGSAGQKREFTVDDDPKNLIELDRAMRDVVTLYGEGDLEAALERARELVARRPGMRMALIELAHLEKESGNLDAAIAALQEAFALHPTDNTTLALLGACLTQAGKPNEAVEITAAHSELAEPDVDVLLVRALALARTQEAGMALATLEKASAIAPDNPLVPVHEGTVRLMAAERGDARAAFERALELDSGTVAAHTALGIMDIEEGRIEAGVEHWRLAVSQDPQQLSKLLAFGTYLWNQQQVAAAKPLLELFVSTAPPGEYEEEIQRVRGALGG